VPADIVVLQALCAPDRRLSHIRKLSLIIFMFFNAFLRPWLLRHLLLGFLGCLQESLG
jgi:hypothetical protein